LSKVQCYRCDKYGHIAQDCLERRSAQRPNANNNSYNNSNNKRGRGLAAHESFEETQHPPKKYKNTRYADNVTNTQSEYFIVFGLSSSSSDNVIYLVGG